MTWRVELEDITVEYETVTVGEAIFFQGMRGKEIEDADPVRTRPDAVALLIAHLMVTDEITQEAAQKRLNPKPLEALKIVELGGDGLPKDESPPDTP